MCLCVIRSGDGTVRLWPFNDSGVGTPAVLQHQFKDIENHKSATKDVTSPEWNVSAQKLQICKWPRHWQNYIAGIFFNCCLLSLDSDRKPPSAWPCGLSNFVKSYWNPRAITIHLNIDHSLGISRLMFVTKPCSTVVSVHIYCNKTTHLGKGKLICFVLCPLPIRMMERF